MLVTFHLATLKAVEVFNCRILLHLQQFGPPPCLQVLFALHPVTLLSGMDLDGVTTQNVEPIHTGSSKVDIFLELFEAANGSVVGHIEYDSSLWQRSSIAQFSAALNVSAHLTTVV